MSNAYVIEVSGHTVGIVARDSRGFRFHASIHALNALDGHVFAGPGEAEKAARRHLRGRETGRDAGPAAWGQG